MVLLKYWWKGLYDNVVRPACEGMCPLQASGGPRLQFTGAWVAEPAHFRNVLLVIF
jgi:hypothetical protein